MSSIDELQHEFSELEHQWFVDRSSDRAPTSEQMDRVMKLAKDALVLAENSVVTQEGFEEIRRELKHRIEAATTDFICELDKQVGEIIDEEVK